MQYNFPEDKIKLIEKNFNLIDDNKDKKINENEFKTLLRLMGQTKTEKEFNTIIEEHFDDESEENENNKSENGINKESLKLGNDNHIKKLNLKINRSKDEVMGNSRNNIEDNTKMNELIKKKKKPINFEKFLKLFMLTYTEPISVDELIKSFEMFDNEKSGYINMEKFKYILTNCNEKLIDTDINLFLNSFNFKDKDKIDYVTLSKKLKNIN
ncbi:calmodulin, putative [Plasmodium gallinaceum]|uniref:Calmodulin n=1 Tax=Plasmodium gallinaceum TaxID=5849 RepID=A0A1J1GXM9_PLAGA|nr:calmodulin, putative [Plasmodium gallinaceum]CRG97322.1 calmodulin, putative [Plasmodium gallinaceum]